MTAFNKDDRVEYIGTYSHYLKGTVGTVVETKSSSNVIILWDDMHAQGVFPENIKLIEEYKPYDPAQAGDEEEDI